MFNALYSPAEFPWAATYFKFQPSEPGGPGRRLIKLSPTFSDSPKVTVDDLHRIVTAMPACSEVVLYTHGFVDKHVGISMWLSDLKRIELTIELITALCDMPPEKVAKQFKIPPDLMKSLHTRILEIQVCQLEHVAFRSCRIGTNPEYLSKFAELFNVHYVTAPKVRDFFANDAALNMAEEDMNKLDRVLMKFAGNHAITSKLNKQQTFMALTRRWLYGPDVLELMILPASYTKFDTRFMATSAAAVERFFADNYYFGAPITFHDEDFFNKRNGPQNMHPKLLPLFGLLENNGGTFYLPRQQAYVNQIVMVKNEHYIGGLPPMVDFPIDPNEKVGRLRDRIRQRVHNVVEKVRR